MIIKARYTEETSTQILTTEDDGRQVTMPSFPSDTHYDNKMQAFLDGGGTIDPFPEALPPLDNDAKEAALRVAQQGEVIWNQDNRRRSVGTTPLIPDEDKTEWDDWMKSVYEAQDAGQLPPEPPVFAREVIAVEGDTTGQCVISWKWFDGTWEGWGFEAIFDRADISSLGLKVYDENGGYLYALTFASIEGQHNRWSIETPAGFATATKVQRSFEIIAGSAPVTAFKNLTDQTDYISLLVRWQANAP